MEHLVKDIKLNLSMGARNNAKTEREENDFYATDPNAVKLFLNKLKEDGVALNKNIWECACGQGHMAEVFKEFNHNVKASDLIDRGYGQVRDFLKIKAIGFEADIFTNPPFKNAVEFAYKGLELLKNKGNKLGLFLKIQFLESVERRKLFDEYPPKYVYVYSNRQSVARDGNFEEYGNKGKTQAYIWVIWEKGYTGEPILRWI